MVTRRDVAASVLIAGVFCATLAPVGRQARERDARQDQWICINRLRALAGAVIVYAQDYDQRLPAHYNPDTRQGLDVVLRPYLKTEDPFRCPARGELSEYSYGFNYFYLDRLRYNRLYFPAATVLMCDAGRRDDGPEVVRFHHVNPPSQPTYANIVRPDWRHAGYSNVSFADGHCKLMGQWPFYPATKSVGGTWAGDAEHGPSRTDPPRVDVLWDNARRHALDH